MFEIWQEILVFLSVAAAVFYLLRRFGLLQGGRTARGCAGSDCACGPLQEEAKRRKS